VPSGERPSQPWRTELLFPDRAVFATGREVEGWQKVSVQSTERRYCKASAAMKDHWQRKLEAEIAANPLVKLFAKLQAMNSTPQDGDI
jgi:cell fate (sporulation/competence/biofilm development) regulator YmcA (YheA/YmcA/DUF963 family)